jgi:ribonuclease HI
LEARHSHVTEVSEPIGTVNIDRAWVATGAWIAAILTLPSGIKLRYAARLEFQCTNNSVEYEAVILDLSKLRALSARWEVIKTDT